MLYLLQRYHCSEKKKKSLKKKFFFFLSLTVHSAVCQNQNHSQGATNLSGYFKIPFFWCLVPKKLFRIESRNSEKAHSFSSTCVSTTLVLHFSFTSSGLFPFSSHEKSPFSFFFHGHILFHLYSAPTLFELPTFLLCPLGV